MCIVYKHCDCISLCKPLKLQIPLEKEQAHLQIQAPHATEECPTPLQLTWNIIEAESQRDLIAVLQSKNRKRQFKHESVQSLQESFDKLKKDSIRMLVLIDSRSWDQLMEDQLLCEAFRSVFKISWPDVVACRNCWVHQGITVRSTLRPLTALRRNSSDLSVGL